ncbi:hypothetical protein K431DRAFT_319756 [Polychaeton citri CBS 116435]|uniref:Plasma membrane fusion protein PRM1 n=1 Tax=Polychaeton citri CBS 116435 TaxID=1314669 RepID=A0A9P4UR95_9PEZI|nr:hypothetical protein K431DRAFT_319756 [Polychaeton citri CBS 116435]
MSFPESQQQTPNPAPPTLSAGGHEMRGYYAAQDAPRPPLLQEPYLTPYLGLRARLSQTWINRWTILLLLVLIRTLIAIASLDDNLASARKQALSACTSVESVGSAMASMPYYMSQGVNQLSADGIEKAVNGLMQMLILSITGVEEIVLFIINLLTSTYVCLITLAVGGSLHVAVEIAESVGDMLNSTAKDVGDDLGDAVKGFQTAMNGFLKGLDNIGAYLPGGDSSVPSIDLTKEIDTLNNLQLPSAYDSDLQKLNGSIPTFEEVHNFTNSLIRLPFEEIKKLINESLPKYHANNSMFPVPQKEQLTFCSDNNGINDFFDKLVHTEHVARKTFLAVIIVAAVLVMIPMAWREYKRHAFMQERAVLVKRPEVDSMDAVYLASRPYTSTAGMWLGDRMSFGSLRLRVAIRWTVAYATTVPALFVLSLGVAGVLSCLCQYVLLKEIAKEVPELTQEVGAFADKVVMQLNNASEHWALGANSIISDTNNTINEDVFGWVNTSTTAVNHTLNEFVDGMVDVLNVTFGGTILYEPILDVLNCLVFLKIEGIEKALTWVHDNAHIDMPLLPNDTFSIGTVSKVAGSQNDILASGPGAEAADAISDAVIHVTGALVKGVKQEAIISLCILLIYLVIVLIGAGSAAFMYFRGGDGVREVYNGPASLPRSSAGGTSGVEKHELRDFFHAPAPTYEQATSTQEAEPGNNFANRYNGQQYTLTPNPLPSFDVHAASPILQTSFSTTKEKVGSVNGHGVDTAIRRHSHVRSSSYGDYAVTSPVSPDLSSDPFADPAR